MAQINAKYAISVVAGVTVVSLLIAFLLPVAMGAFYGQADSTYDMTEGQTVEITANLNATLDDANQTTGIDMTLQDGASSATIIDLAEGANQTVTINTEDVTVTNDNVTSATNATVTFEYAKTYGWSDGATSLFVIIPLMLLIVVVLFIVAMAMNAYKQA